MPLQGVLSRLRLAFFVTVLLGKLTKDKRLTEFLKEP